jgi:hypothetical protein
MIRHEAPYDSDGLRSAPPRVNQDFRIRARWNDEFIGTRSGYRFDGCRMVGVIASEERNHHACVENDYRHSRRSFRREPLG